ncbi:MAG: HAD-IIIC family phosphatase [Gemmatimonadales bacterium]|nr:HAD-IIIC family phosphatase [Gemmatimonadales bacterium]
MTSDHRIDSATLQRIASGVLPNQPWSAYQAAARSLDRIPWESIPEHLRTRVAMLGSFTLDPFVPVLRVEAARVGLWLEPYVAPYGQYVSELLDPNSGLYRFQPHVTFLAIDADVLWNQRWAETQPLKSEPVVGGLLTPLFAGLDVFDRAGSGILVMNDFVLPRLSSEGVNAFRSKGTFAHTVAHANKHLRLRLASRDDTFLFPLSDAVAQVGRAQAFNWRTHYRGHVTWSDPLMRDVAERYVGFALAAMGKATKCIVLDLDNTLWGGVLGEDGPAGIALGPQWPGSEFVDFQRELLDLQRQGILLALCSKNNESEVLAVLREHPSMLIREAHLAAYRINWEDKATNIRALARELNIGLDHMLLIDDSPHERTWVHDQIPELRVPDPPADPSMYAGWVGSLSSLMVLRQTAEDAQRTRQYQESRVREEYRGAVGSMEDFLRGLGLRVAIDHVEDESMSRVVQLLAKTNQFNLTTRRHDEATIRRQIASGAWRVYTMKVADRFGDFGLTGAAILEQEADAWHLESFLLSCRVIGKSVETALLARIAEDARAAGASALSAEFIDSGRNQVASALLPNHGFATSDDGRWHRPLDLPGPEWPAWISPAALHPTGAVLTNSEGHRDA